MYTRRGAYRLRQMAFTTQCILVQTPKRGFTIACRPSVHPSVRPSMTLVDCGHIGWNRKSRKLNAGTILAQHLGSS